MVTIVYGKGAPLGSVSRPLITAYGVRAIRNAGLAEDNCASVTFRVHPRASTDT